MFRFHFTEFKDWHKSEWEELHSMRKALAVVGIIDGAVTTDWVRFLSHAYDPTEVTCANATVTSV